MDNQIDQSIIKKVVAKQIAIYKVMETLPPRNDDLWGEKNFIQQSQNNLKHAENVNCVTTNETKNDSTKNVSNDTTNPDSQKSKYPIPGSQHVKYWRQRTKERIVQAFGGQCGICGYNRCEKVMELHHVDPAEKEFPLGQIRGNPKSWDKVVTELRKCVMLCANCHREYHAGLITIPDNIKRFDETFADYKTLQEEDRRRQYYNPCPICGKEKFHRQKTCSLNCSAKLSGMYDWDKYDLKKLYIDDKLNYSQIGRMIGCTGNAVKKRLKKLKLIPS